MHYSVSSPAEDRKWIPKIIIDIKIKLGPTNKASVLATTQSVSIFDYWSPCVIENTNPGDSCYSNLSMD